MTASSSTPTEGVKRLIKRWTAYGQKDRSKLAGGGGARQDTDMLHSHPQMVRTSSGRPGLEAQPQTPEPATRLLDLLSSTPQAEQGNPRSGEGAPARGPLQRSQSARQTTKKEHRPQRRSKKAQNAAEAEDVFAPRKPSFPFQWAWESFITRSSAQAQPGASSDWGSPAFSQLTSRHRSAASLPEALGFCRKLEAQNFERRQQPGGWSAPPLSKGESPGLQVPRESTLWPPRKSARPELEWAEAEEHERDLSPSELPQLPQLPLRALTLEEGLFSDMPGQDEEGEHQASQMERRPGPQNKGQNCGEEASSEGHGRGHGSGSDGLGGSQRRKVKAKELQGPWDLEMPRRRLQQNLDCGAQKQPWKAFQTPGQASDRSGKAHVVGEDEIFPSTNFPNRTFHKRQEATRSLLQAWERKQQEERHQAELRRAREQRVQQQVARCLAAYGSRANRRPWVNQRKLEELRRQERQRFAEYQAELQGIQHRVQSRPYLFQQAMQANARLSVTRRFSQVLSALGLDEEQVLAEAGKGEPEGSSRKPRCHRSPGVSTQHLPSQGPQRQTAAAKATDLKTPA
ncbi:testis-specific protein 10-interacting protein [Ochotona princeps]|uniref:testis-specific protein 10-interacting protein n=1 Tax=Ochotona princeps TaxID=9978 RepID=UPI0027152233|nr:testis-specific protein 10-interacting protein [Ochotona princeps]